MLIAKKGALAVKSLTGDAIIQPPSKFPSNPADNSVRQFQKKGDYRKAIQDLVALFPERIKDFSTPSGVSYFYAVNVNARWNGVLTEYAIVQWDIAFHIL